MAENVQYGVTEACSEFTSGDLGGRAFTDLANESLLLVDILEFTLSALSACITLYIRVLNMHV